MLFTIIAQMDQVFSWEKKTKHLKNTGKAREFC